MCSETWKRFGMMGVVAVLLLGAAPVWAAEVSVLSGLYRSEESEQGSTDLGSKSTISAGGRYADVFDDHMFWFAEADLILRSYKKGDLGDAPSNSTSLRLGGGLRYDFERLAEHVIPYVLGYGQFRGDRDGSFDGTDVVETETNGLFYGAAFGIRFGLSPDFFVDFETLLFDSALFATEKRESSDPGQPNNRIERETKRTDLYFDTSGALGQVRVALGMRI